MRSHCSSRPCATYSRPTNGMLFSALQAMTRDKKARAGQLRFAVLEKIGAPALREVSPAEVDRALIAALGGAR